MRLFPLAVVVAVLGLAGSASAQLFSGGMIGLAQPEQHPTASWYGSTGLVTVPTARIGGLLRVNAGAHQVDRDEKTQDVVTANVALLSQLEVGATHMTNVYQGDRDVAADEWKDETIFNAKYRMGIGNLFSLVDAPDIAVGVWDVADNVDRTFYVVASQKIPADMLGAPSALNVHLGFGRTESRTGRLDGLFGGIDFSPFRNALVQAEYDGEDINAALRYYIVEWAAVDVGVVSGDLGWGVSVRTGF